MALQRGGKDSKNWYVRISDFILEDFILEDYIGCFKYIKCE